MSKQFLCSIYLPVFCQLGPKKSDREFQIDIQHYVNGRQCGAGYICHFPTENSRFAKSVPSIRTGGMACVTGSISRTSVKSHGDFPIQRMVVDVNDITFLTRDSGVGLGSPVKGNYILLSRLPYF
jgi:hypothetical protein